MSSPPSSEGDPPDDGKSSPTPKNEAAAAAGGGEDEMEDIKQFVIRSSQSLKKNDPEDEEADAKLPSKPAKEEVKDEKDDKERGLPPPLPQPKLYVMPKTTATAAAAEKSLAATPSSGQLPPPATKQITIRAPTVQKAVIGPKIQLQQNIQVTNATF